MPLENPPINKQALLKDIENMDLTPIELNLLESVHHLFSSSRKDHVNSQDNSNESASQNEDELFHLITQHPGCVFAFDTALYLHGLIAEKPEHLAIIETKENDESGKEHAVPLKYVTLVKTPGGNLVPVITPEHAFLECLAPDTMITFNTLVEAWFKLYALPSFELSDMSGYSQEMGVQEEFIVFIERLLGE